MWTTEPWLEAELGRKEVITVEDWAEIRRLNRAEGLSIKEIAKHLGVARNTVRSALRRDVAPKYERKGPGSAVDAVEPEIKELLAEFPKMPATVIAERIGWERSMTVLKDRVRELRPSTCPPIPASAASTARESWPSGICGSRPWTSPWLRATGLASRSSSGCWATPASSWPA